ncbi:hypothetical protein AZI87_17435 [Bdellovibrio bacteriovorus]|uniref:Uncharacterized protein n=1 Tax=Bdellovibrio bacteriovorus TaxID=959 RepID=A0A162FUA3_BDEBC|nr:hypothetical protein AZI87_17435 [Bdellovibrio bacteriovorus]
MRAKFYLDKDYIISNVRAKIKEDLPFVASDDHQVLFVFKEGFAQKSICKLRRNGILSELGDSQNER